MKMKMTKFIKDKQFKNYQNISFRHNELKRECSKLIQLMQNNTSTKWDFSLQYTFDCIVTETGENEHEDKEYSETYTGENIWSQVDKIKKYL